MIYKLLNRKSFNGIIFIPLFTLLIWSPILLSDVWVLSQPRSLFLLNYWSVEWNLIGHYLSFLFAILLTLIAAFILQQIDSGYGILQRKTFLPAFLFIVMAGGLSDLQMLHPVHLAMPFLLMGIFQLFKAPHNRLPLKNFFDAGFLLGTGILFLPQLIYFLPLFLMAGIILVKELQWRLFVLPLLGTGLPLLLLFGILFLTNQSDIIESMLNTPIFQKDAFNFFDPINLLMLIAINASFLLLAVIKIWGFSDERRNLHRKYHQFFLLMLLNTAGIILISGYSTASVWLATAPAAILISILLSTYKRSQWIDFILYLMLLSALILNDNVVAIFLSR